MSVDYRQTLWFVGPLSAIQQLASTFAYQPGDERAFVDAPTYPSLSAHQTLDFQGHRVEREQTIRAHFRLPPSAPITSDDVAAWYHDPTNARVALWHTATISPQDPDHTPPYIASTARLAGWLLPHAPEDETQHDHARLWSYIREEQATLRGAITILPSGQALFTLCTEWCRRNVPAIAVALHQAEALTLGPVVLIEGMINDCSHDYSYNVFRNDGTTSHINDSRHSIIDPDGDGLSANHPIRRAMVRQGIPSEVIDVLLSSTAIEDRNAYAEVLRRVRHTRKNPPAPQPVLESHDDNRFEYDEIPF